MLILRGFKCLFPEVLILVGFKSWIMSEMREFARFLEVLILGELRGKKCWILVIAKVFGEGLCWGRIPDDSRLIHHKSIVLYGYSNRNPQRGGPRRFKNASTRQPIVAATIVRTLIFSVMH